MGKTGINTMVHDQIKARGIEDPRILKAFAGVDRSGFVPEAMKPHACEDRPLPIGGGQTISQPYIVALMTSLLDPQPHHRMLDIGTGSGYQAAILSQLVQEVFSLEIVPELARTATRRLEDLGYSNITVRCGDGWSGWPEQAPFDGIVLAAALPHIPGPLFDQLAPGGRLVAPVGPVGGIQTLELWRKEPDGHLQRSRHGSVVFVPFVH